MRSELFKEYLNSIIAQDLSKKQKTEIRAEFENHLEDKTDWYMEIGYNEDAAAQRAVAEMGGSDLVRVELLKIHKKNFWLPFIFYSVLFFVFIIYTYNTYDYLFAVVKNHSAPTFETVRNSFIFLNLTIVFLYLCRIGKKFLLSGFLAVYFAMSALIVFPFGTFFAFLTHPAIYALMTNINSLLGKHLLYINDHYVWMITHLVLFFCGTYYCIISAKSAYKATVYKKTPMKKYHLRFVVFLTLSVFASIALTTEYKSIYNARGSYYCLGPTEKHLATVYPLTHASEDQFNKISVGMTLDEVCKILDNKYLATVTQIKDSYFSEELKKNTSKCMVYDLVLNPTTTNLHLARITLMFDAKGLLIGKKFGVFEFNNTWLNGTQRLKLFIKNRLKEGMTNKDVSKIIHNAGVYPGTVTYERINGKTSEEYYYTFGPFNGGVPYDYGDVFGRYDYYGSNDWETLTLWFEDGKLTVISW